MILEVQIQLRQNIHSIRRENEQKIFLWHRIQLSNNLYAFIMFNQAGGQRAVKA